MSGVGWTMAALGALAAIGVVRHAGSATFARRLVLISCSKAKASGPGPFRSAELYGPSALFRGAHGLAQARGLPWMVLSAKHGLLDPQTKVAPYNETLLDRSSAERRAWGQRVVADLRRQGWLSPGTVLEVHAGAAYVGPLREALAAFPEVILEEPLQGLMLGERLQWYKQKNNRAQGTQNKDGWQVVDDGIPEDAAQRIIEYRKRMEAWKDYEWKVVPSQFHRNGSVQIEARKRSGSGVRLGPLLPARSRASTFPFVVRVRVDREACDRSSWATHWQDVLRVMLEELDQADQAEGLTAFRGWHTGPRINSVSGPEGCSFDFPLQRIGYGVGVSSLRVLARALNEKKKESGILSFEVFEAAALSKGSAVRLGPLFPPPLTRWTSTPWVRKDSGKVVIYTLETAAGPISIAGNPTARFPEWDVQGPFSPIWDGALTWETPVGAQAAVEAYLRDAVLIEDAFVGAFGLGWARRSKGSAVRLGPLFLKPVGPPMRRFQGEITTLKTHLAMLGAIVQEEPDAVWNPLGELLKRTGSIVGRGSGKSPREEAEWSANRDYKAVLGKRFWVWDSVLRGVVQSRQGQAVRVEVLETPPAMVVHWNVATPSFLEPVWKVRMIDPVLAHVREKIARQDPREAWVGGRIYQVERTP